jgi:hypothetical protein
MSLLIVVGYDGPGASAKPVPVYMGRVRSEADAAMAASTAVRFGIIRNPVELRKNGKQSASAWVVEPAAEESSEVASDQPAGPEPVTEPVTETPAAAALEADAEAAANETAEEPAIPVDGAVSGKRRR